MLDVAHRSAAGGMIGDARRLLVDVGPERA
jgi:hypothetical protein